MMSITGTAESPVSLAAFRLFDRMMLLLRGRPVYFGERGGYQFCTFVTPTSCPSHSVITALLSYDC